VHRICGACNNQCLCRVNLLSIVGHVDLLCIAAMREPVVSCTACYPVWRPLCH
jgi:hypothetical protein